MIKNLLRSTARKLGYEIHRANSDGSAMSLSKDFEPEFRELIRRCQPFTLTSPERMYSLWGSVRYICMNNIPGDFVECGVWKGGSAMLIALTLKSLGQQDRDIYLYDTFAGMSEPTEKDVNFAGGVAKTRFDALKREGYNEWAFASLDEVRKNLSSTGYPTDRIHFVKGKVEDTIPATIPALAALVRLDTDWYESTIHEFRHLYPRLASRGVLIIDDYGHWLGARKATDEYFEQLPFKPLLHRIDYTGRVLIKIDN